MNLSAILITSREKPLLEWFFDSLRGQVKPEDRIQVIVVDLALDHIAEAVPQPRMECVRAGWNGVLHVPGKPTVWQGRYRVTSKNWWAASNSRNTGICLAQHAWLSFLDDRCVLLPGWLDSIREAQAGKYAVFGAYEKRVDITVTDGVIIHSGTVIGEDSREKYVREHWGGTTPAKCPGEWAFGCNLALPLEWALVVNGYEELMDGLSAEDVVFGKHLENNGFDLRYDSRMKIIEDRTASELGEGMPRESKQRFPHDPLDKGHKALERFTPLKRASHQWDIRAVRADVMRGLPFPVPTGPTHDWFDNEPLSEMTWPWIHPDNRK